MSDSRVMTWRHSQACLPVEATGLVRSFCPPVDATGEPPGRSELKLPECQQPHVKACSKGADPQPMRGYWYMWRPHLFCLRSRLDARWQEAWHRHDNKSCERCSSRAGSPHFLRFDDSAVACFFPLSGSGYNSGSSGPCCQLWHAASEPCQCAHVHLPKQ